MYKMILSYFPGEYVFFKRISCRKRIHFKTKMMQKKIICYSLRVQIYFAEKRKQLVSARGRKADLHAEQLGTAPRRRRAVSPCQRHHRTRSFGAGTLRLSTHLLLPGGQNRAGD